MTKQKTRWLGKVLVGTAVVVVGGYVMYVLCTLMYVNRVLPRRWKAQVRSEQDPAVLQAWATQLLAQYAASNHGEMLFVSNGPPSGIPISRFGPRVVLRNDSIWGGGYYVELSYGGGFAELWGMRIGDTNFVSSGGEKWIPGVYFIR